MRLRQGGTASMRLYRTRKGVVAQDAGKTGLLKGQDGVANSAGKIVGWTICNDMSSRDIEGENPLYLPQAKVYDLSCALGPAILVSPEMPPPATQIQIEILSSGVAAFSGATGLDRLK